MTRHPSFSPSRLLALLAALLLLAAPALAEGTLAEQLEAGQPGLEGAFTPEDFLAWQQAWRDRLPALLSEIGEPDPARGPFDPGSLIHALRQEILLPDEGMAAPGEALAAARQAVLGLPEWTETKLSMYAHQGTLCYRSESYGRPMYFVLFAQKEAGLGEFKSLGYCTVRRDYGQPLDMMFGGLGTSGLAPWYVSVLLDARNLQPAEPPQALRLSDRGWIDPYWQLR